VSNFSTLCINLDLFGLICKRAMAYLGLKYYFHKIPMPCFCCILSSVYQNHHKIELHIMIPGLPKIRGGLSSNHAKPILVIIQGYDKPSIKVFVRSKHYHIGSNTV